MEELRKQHPWKSINKFMPYALQKGFTESDVKKYFKENVLKDKFKINGSQFFLPIYGKTNGCYQFDTLIQSKKASVPAFLVFININSRKGYAYPMMNKGKNEVLRALKEFTEEVKDNVNSLTSDQDAAYLNSDVIDFINSKGIDYHTTEDNNHNVLGIINRFIKTLRDMNKERDFTTGEMKKCINEYNATEHSSIGKAPNDFNSDDEKEHIKLMEEKTNNVLSNPEFSLNKGDKVRIVLDNKPLEKKRSNLSDKCYIVDSINGYGYNIRSKDYSTAFFPRYKLIKSSKGEIAETLDNGKRGFVDKIISYDQRTDKYKVIYEGGVKDEIKAKALRETHPTKLSDLEIEYWRNNKNKIPASISKYKGLI